VLYVMAYLALRQKNHRIKLRVVKFRGAKIKLCCSRLSPYLLISTKLNVLFCSISIPDVRSFLNKSNKCV